MGLESTLQMMGRSMLVIGSKTSSMVMAKKPGEIIRFLKVLTVKVPSMVEVFISMQMDLYMMGNFVRISFMGKGP
jgi:hypothetical protein